MLPRERPGAKRRPRQPPEPPPLRCLQRRDEATDAMLIGEPFQSLADACRRQAAEEATSKVVSFADLRAKLRPATASPER